MKRDDGFWKLDGVPTLELKDRLALTVIENQLFYSLSSGTFRRRKDISKARS
jgi:hypothetical protein